MSYIDIKEFLDRQIAWKEEGESIKDFNSQIRVYGIPEARRIHMNDIDVVADLMGMELVEEDHCEEYVERSFMYKGYTVFGLVEKYDTQNLSD